ncbi:MAG: hypothetical protein IJ801_01820, partial [Lachnospiraceae bacterium]|nr:hypothetical protein [Lachnospiraceae bacterium]
HYSGLSTDSEIIVASNKTLYCAYGNTKPTKIDIGKSTQKLNLEKLSKKGLYVIPNKRNTGNYKITVNVKQEGESYSFVLKLTVKKYVSPFQSFKIGSADLTSTFKNHRTISDANYGKVSLKTAKKTLGGQRLSVKVKKGYKVYKITYRRKDEWGTKPHNFKFTTLSDGTLVPAKLLEKDFWELYIYYKKGNKKMGYTCVYWSYAVFN